MISTEYALFFRLFTKWADRFGIRMFSTIKGASICDSMSFINDFFTSIASGMFSLMRANIDLHMTSFALGYFLFELNCDSL